MLSCAYITEVESKPDESKPDKQQPTASTCIQCTNMGRSWQLDKCNPTDKCKRSDVPCYQTTKSCAHLKQPEQGKEACPEQQSCSACVTVNPECGWSKAEQRCVVYTVWSTADLYIRWDKAKCEGSSPQMPQPGATQSTSLACHR